MFLVANAVSIAVLRRRPEIATLRALGASRAAIFAAFSGRGPRRRHRGDRARRGAGLRRLARGPARGRRNGLHDLCSRRRGSRARAAGTRGPRRARRPGGLAARRHSCRPPKRCASRPSPAHAGRARSRASPAGACGRGRCSRGLAAAPRALSPRARGPVDGFPLFGFAAVVSWSSRRWRSRRRSSCGWQPRSRAAFSAGSLGADGPPGRRVLRRRPREERHRRHGARRWRSA